MHDVQQTGSEQRTQGAGDVPVAIRDRQRPPDEAGPRNGGAGKVLADAALGALAGAAAAWLMGKATTYMYEHEDRQAREMEDEARGGKMAYGIAAEKTAHLLGKDLTDDERKRYGSAVHWGISLGAGAAYGALRHRVPGMDWGRGLAFGAGFFLLFDEGANTLLGFTPPPQDFPWQAHARGLVGHLVYGLSTEALLEVADGLR